MYTHIFLQTGKRGSREANGVICVSASRSVNIVPGHARVVVRYVCNLKHRCLEEYGHLIDFHPHVSYLVSLKIQLEEIGTQAPGFASLVTIVFVPLFPVAAQKHWGATKVGQRDYFLWQIMAKVYV